MKYNLLAVAMFIFCFMGGQVGKKPRLRLPRMWESMDTLAKETLARSRDFRQMKAWLQTTAGKHDFSKIDGHPDFKNPFDKLEFAQMHVYSELKDEELTKARAQDVLKNKMKCAFNVFKEVAANGHERTLQCLSKNICDHVKGIFDKLTKHAVFRVIRLEDEAYFLRGTIKPAISWLASEKYYDIFPIYEDQEDGNKPQLNLIGYVLLRFPDKEDDKLTFYAMWAVPGKFEKLTKQVELLGF